MATDIKQSRYEKEKRRLSVFINMKTASDKDIIEYLSEEIEQYRNKITKLNKTIYELRERTMQSEEMFLDTEDDELIDKDITEIISTTRYADGKPIQSTMEYKYDNKEDGVEGSTCPPIEPELRPGF